MTMALDTRVQVLLPLGLIIRLSVDDIDFNGTLPYDDKTWRWDFGLRPFGCLQALRQLLVSSSFCGIEAVAIWADLSTGTAAEINLCRWHSKNFKVSFQPLSHDEQLVAGVACAFMPEFVSFTITRVILGSCTSGTFMTVFVMTNEMVGEPWRVTGGLGFQYAFTVGYCLVGVFAIFVRDWFWLQLAVTAPGLLMLPYWWCTSESVRWLLANDKDNEASDLIRKAAKVNKVIVPDYVFKQKAVRNEEEVATANHVHAKMIDLFRNWTTCKITLNLFFIW
ncbi:PREDICTED: organic cation transporter protein-like [Priapulus caudatus]|uniref:Organic cation transporter protein-like n=1 Tax=Priapulus caudatus TaxID=37621 RepID=A0ABM1E4W6_PRICU|nr:PREDICTED: organic cation transporter protein-like [Priapulus caudatus]